jgi:membrane protein required for beta-lactamase induction
MAFIYVLLSLLFERYLGSLHEFRNYRWFDRFTDRIRELIPELAKHPLFGVFLLVLVPALGVGLVYGVLNQIWSVFGFAFAFAMLLYGYGCQDLETQIESFIDALLRGDDEAVRWHLAATLRGELRDAQQPTRALIETVLVELNDRLLAVVFWFVLLGPAGALAFRLASLLRNRFQREQNDFTIAANQAYQILAWLPARLTAFSYALAGSFVEAMQYRREEAYKWRDENDGILATSGLGALQYAFASDETANTRDNEIAALRAALALVRRTVMLWLGALAILALLGTIVSLQLEGPA